MAEFMLEEMLKSMQNMHQFPTMIDLQLSISSNILFGK